MEIKSHERENIQNHFFYVLNYKDLLSGLNLGGGGRRNQEVNKFRKAKIEAKLCGWAKISQRLLRYHG